MSTTDKTPFMPPKPKFGDIEKTGTDVWAAWTGGKPNGAWTGLQDPKPAAIGPNQYRPMSIASQAKALAYRVQGLETKFSRTSDLQTFEKKIMKHLVQYGLDTITYMPDPTDKETKEEKAKVVSVITDHARFNLKQGVKKANEIMEKHFDAYDIANVRDAKEFLLNSIDADLETQLYENCTDEDSFCAYWFNLIHIVRSVSID